MVTIQRTFKGIAHTGYVVTNDLGAQATVVEAKFGHIVRTETDVFYVKAPASLVAARDIAISEVSA